MVFSSTVFLFVFLPATLAGYYLIRNDLRNAFLLLMSLLFYASGEPKFVFVMVLSIIANYGMGLVVHLVRKKNVLLRRCVLVLVVGVNLGLLFYYKYYDFAINNINALLHTSIAQENIVLPIGISFFTFQSMSYVLDVYMGKTQVQKNPLDLALYVAYFPQLIAGPIVRYSDVNEEIQHRRETVDDFSSGVQRFTVGLSKKVVLSNSFAVLADQAFNALPGELGIGMAWLGALAYAMQIYFDFSGYSDMAIGLGRMFGFHFRENFNYPYTSQSVTIFWRRWHISLSSWFRDYVYIPLGGNRKGNVYVNLFIVFLLTGLWHGASWNFVCWGLWHGMFLIIERIFRKHNIKIKVPRTLGWLYTMMVVLVGWVLFRAPGLKKGFMYLQAMIGMRGLDLPSLAFYLKSYIGIFIIGILAATPILQRIRMSANQNETYKAVLDYAGVVLCGVLLLVNAAFVITSTYNPFIYFNF